MTVTGWTQEPPEDEAPAVPQTSFLLAARAERGPVDPWQCARDARDDDGDPFDPDEHAANLLARGYRPGQVSQLSRELADDEAELAGLRKIDADAETRRARAWREHQAGRVDALSMQAMMDGPEASASRMAFLERRIARKQQELADAQAVIAPQQRQAEDPLEAASRHAHQLFVQVTRRRMADAAAGRSPVVSRPKEVSRSRGADAVRSEHCEHCTTYDVSDEYSYLLHLDPEFNVPVTPPQQAGAAQRRADEMAGYEHEVTRLTDAGYSLATAKAAAVPMIYR
jgi:hypothetical protein